MPTPKQFLGTYQSEARNYRSQIKNDYPQPVFKDRKTISLSLVTNVTNVLREILDIRHYNSHVLS